jgi:undecaprenyl-diphosphatase
MLNIAIQGLIQGLTEFLPVSSSGHLTLFQFFSGRTNFEENLAIDVTLHFGTLLAVIFFFRHDLRPFFTVSGWKEPANRKLAGLIITASIPTAVLGLVFKKQFESLFANPVAVCIALFATGLILLLAERTSRRHQTGLELAHLTTGKALIVGLAQGLAITPGISRSGSTIGTSLLCGLNAEAAARFSFLLMIPAVGGATILEGRKLINGASQIQISGIELLVGAVVSAITGFLALNLLVFMLKKQKLSIFSYYLFLVSTISLIAILGR